MNTQNVNRAYENLIVQLRAIRRQWRWLIFSEGLLKCLGILALIGTGVLVVFAFSLPMWQLPFSHWIRMGILLVSIGVAVYAVVRALVLPLRRRLTDAAVAARLESTQAESGFASENRILSAVQLWRTLTDNRLGYAPEFIEHLILQTSRDMEQVQPKQVFQSEFRKIRRNAGVAVGGIGLLLITSFFLPTAFMDFAHSFRALPTTLQTDAEGLKNLIQITEIQPGNAQVERGSDVDITAQVNGHFGAPVELYYRVGEADEAASIKWEAVLMQRTSDSVDDRNEQVPALSLSYRVTLEKVSRPLQYYVSVESVGSEQYQLTISDEPVVTQFQYRLNYPTYTQLQPQTLPANTGDIQTLFGTEVVFAGESNKPLEKASLVFEVSDDMPLAVKAAVTRQSGGQPGEDGQVPEATQMSRGIQGSFIAQQSQRYQIRITDGEGFMNQDPINYTLTVFEDVVPDVSIVAPARDTVLDNSMLVELKVEAADDYGIQELQLVYRVEVEGAEEVNVPLKRWGIEGADVRRAVFLNYTWDVDRDWYFSG